MSKLIDIKKYQFDMNNLWKIDIWWKRNFFKSVAFEIFDWNSDKISCSFLSII